MEPRQLHILRHSLGVGDDGRRPAYRNHFVTGEGSKDYPDCMVLVESGHMARRNGSPLTGGDDLFTVTETGWTAAIAPPAPPEKLTAGQRRYRSYLRADSGLPFGQWLKSP